MKNLSLAVVVSLSVLTACGGGGAVPGGPAAPSVVTQVNPTGDLSGQATSFFQNELGNIQVQGSGGLIFDPAYFNANYGGGYNYANQSAKIRVQARTYSWSDIYSQVVIPMLRSCEAQAYSSYYGNNSMPTGAMTNLDWGCVRDLQNTFENNWAVIYVRFEKSNRYASVATMAWVINQFLTTGYSAQTIYPRYYQGYQPQYVQNYYGLDQYQNNSYSFRFNGSLGGNNGGVQMMYGASNPTYGAQGYFGYQY